MKPTYFIMCLALISNLQAGTTLKQFSRSTPPAVTGLPTLTLININRISSWYSGDGIQEENLSNATAGLTYPRGTATAVFSSGLVWGGRFRDDLAPELRVNGTAYNTGMKRGAILGTRTGISEDPASPDVRVWRIRRDFATADLRQDAAEINRVPLEEVTDEMVASVRAQYQTDWIEWPWEKGAPFYDLNHNGTGDPDEEPGLAGADQVVWFVCNDLDVLQPWTNVEGGIELQMTVWGYNQSGPLGDAIFKRARFIYKGTIGTSESAVIDSMYVCHFSEVDLGSWGDDFAGCDSTISLGYVYNGQPSDEEYGQFGVVPPSVGYRLVQGPIEFTGNPSDTALYDFHLISGAKNIPMTSFVYDAAGNNFGLPPFNSDGGIQWYQMMRGLPPTPQGPPDPLPPIDPYTMERAGPFWLYAGSDGTSSPDPANPNGWVDGMLDPPSDRAIYPSTGPFQMALGDTQDIVFAVVGGLGEDYLQSVAVMKANSSLSQTTYNELMNLPAPTFSVQTSFSGGPVANLTILADATAGTPAAIRFVLKRTDNSVAATDILYDDGTHGDVTPGDFVFTNMVSVNTDPQPMHLDATVTYDPGNDFTWEHIYDGIPTIGTISLVDLRIFSDNFNNDGEANPGENVRYGFTLSYSGILPLSNVVVTAFPGGNSLTYTLIPNCFIDSLVYNPDDPLSFFSVDIPNDFAGSILSIEFSAIDSLNNIFRNTLLMPVVPLSTPVRQAEVTHTQGGAGGEFEILVLDSASVPNHLYVIQGINEPGGFLGFTLRDSTAGTTLLDHYPFPDEFGHNIPVTDGFKVMRGSIEPAGGWDTSLVEGNTVWDYGLSNSLNLEGFHGAMGSGWLHWFSGSTLPSTRASNVSIKFASTDIDGNPVSPDDSLVSYAYRYLEHADEPPAQPEFAPYIIHPDSGFPFQSFERSVPFAAYDISGNSPRRLAVGHLENNVTNGLVNGSYWPPYFSGNSIESSPREWFFIFDVNYSETSDPLLEADILNDTLPLLWWGTPRRNGNISFQNGDEFQIVAFYPYHSSDVWTFNPTILLGSPEEQGTPAAFKLWQNYPNPFNPATTITYQLPVASQVSLKIYNILGQEVRTVVHEIEAAGSKSVVWNGTNNRGVHVSSGMYFCRMEATELSARGLSHVATVKMMLVR